MVESQLGSQESLVQFILVGEPCPKYFVTLPIACIWLTYYVNSPYYWYSTILFFSGPCSLHFSVMMNVYFICKFFTISGAINLQPQHYQSLLVSLASLILPNFEKEELWTSITAPEPLNLFKVPLQCTLIDFFICKAIFN